MNKRNALWALVMALGLTSLWSQELPTRFRGQVVAWTGTSLTIKERSGQDMVFDVSSDQAIQEVYPVNSDQIQPHSFIGSAGLINSDGSVKALEVLIFPEIARGTGEGHFPWDLQEGSTMTNATVDQLQRVNEAIEMKVKYKGGEKSIKIDKDTPVVSLRPADKTLLVPGAWVMVSAIQKAGQWHILRLNVGRNGFKPPM